MTSSINNSACHFCAPFTTSAASYDKASKEYFYSYAICSKLRNISQISDTAEDNNLLPYTSQ